MSYGRTAGLLGVLFVLIIGLLCSISGCASKRYPAQSWDQDNLKRYDRGCPTAIFVAPHGDLVQCQMPGLYVYEKPPLSLPPFYDTIEQAAIAGFKIVADKPTGSFYEWGGQIIKSPGGKYAALPANTSYEGDSVAIKNSPFSRNAVVVGDYHTHPCMPEHWVEYFSEEDLMGSIFYRRTIFMGDFCTGKVHEFKVGDKPDVEKPAPNERTYVTKGRIVGVFTVPHPMMVVE